MAIAKLKEFTGVQRAAPERIKKNEMEQAQRSAQYALDCQMLDLKNRISDKGGQAALGIFEPRSRDSLQ